MSEPTMSDLHNTMERCVEKIDKVNTDVTDIKVGLYGKLSEPGTGFINETQTNIKSLDGKVKTLLDDRKERKRDKKWTLRTAFAAAIAALAALIKTFIPWQATSP